MIPIYEQLINQIKASILRGELNYGDALPSVRCLAAELRISSLTVKKAYDILEDEGFIITVHGKGSYIARTDTQLVAEARRHEIEQQLSDAVARAKSAGMSKNELHELFELLMEDF